MQSIPPQELKEKIESNGAAGRLLDVRTYPEHRAVHVRGARLMPLDRLDPAAVREAFPGDEPVYVLCKSGQRAKRACERLESADLKNLVLVEGGTEAAVAAGLPVERGRGTIDLMRQVRIVVGSVVLVGTGLGAFVSPWWLVLPAFFGAGLLFAGLSGTCGMAMLLSKMPWNRGPGGQGSCGTPRSCAAPS